MVAIKANLVTKNQHSTMRLLIVGAFTVLIMLEFSTPPSYVFGYLYIGPILLTNSRLSHPATLILTLSAASLTILNLFSPALEPIQPSTVANRLIAVMALAVTCWLLRRNQHYEEAIQRQQTQLRSQQQLASIREDFASTLTHDLKTPLLGAIETIKSFQLGHFGDCTLQQQTVLAMMVRSHTSTLHLVETLLDVYRNDTKGLKLVRSPVNLVTLATEAIATLTDLASSRRVYITLRHGSTDFHRFLWVNGDALQLQRVFINLLTNGINHSPRGGKVEVILEYHANYQIVKIIDNGQGITEEELPYLFERFYQGHSDRVATGSGLGLYLTRQIIEAHGGTIWGENQKPRGAMFGFRLPPHLVEIENKKG